MVHVTKMTTADGRLNHTLACELRWAQVYEIMTAVGRLQCKLQGLAKRGVYFAGAVCVRVRVCVYVCWKGEVVKDWWSKSHNLFLPPLRPPHESPHRRRRHRRAGLFPMCIPNLLNSPWTRTWQGGDIVE